MTKLCINCKHIRASDTKADECKLAVSRVSLVDGHTIFEACYSARKPYESCGPEGKLFEQKESIWQRVKQQMKTNLQMLISKE